MEKKYSIIINGIDNEVNKDVAELVKQLIEENEQMSSIIQNDKLDDVVCKNKEIFYMCLN